MNPTKKQARMAGLLYLLMGITGVFGILYVPSEINIEGDSTATVNNILNYELLFRLGIVSRLMCQTIFIFLVLALYNLFKEVNSSLARLMVALVLVAVPIAFLYEINQIAALVLVSGSDFLSVFEANQLNALVMFFLNLFDQGIFIVEIFWGLWLFPLGYLAYKSGFIPKIIGILLIIACFAYVIEFLTNILIPAGADTVSKVIPILTIGEIVMMLWLLVKGVKNNKSASIEAG